MDIYELIEKRSSIRSYLPEEVDEEKLKRVLNAGRLAPSGKNAQAWKFIVTGSDKLKDRLVEACNNQKFITEADKIITVCVDKTEVFQNHGDYMTSFAVDGAIAMDHMILAATEEGLGTCWIGAFNEDKVRDVLNIPEPYQIVALTPLGYPVQKEQKSSRKDLSQVVIWEKWDK